MKTVAILQSNYIPWKGYFDLIAAVDEFIIFDDMQFTRRDWRNRNQVKTPQGRQWLTIPVDVKGKYSQTIFETRIADAHWAARHWKILQLNYAKAPCFTEIADWLKPLYLECHHEHLSQLNRGLVEAICDYLNIRTCFSSSADYQLVEDKTERLVSICQQAGADRYLSGPAAKDYIDENRFDSANIQVSWFDYSGYPEYPQLWGDFEHKVSILDLLFNCGRQASEYMKLP